MPKTTVKMPTKMPAKMPTKMPEKMPTQKDMMMQGKDMVRKGMTMMMDCNKK
jgi:hypothetical protein